jgi:hypothetical protein
MPCLQCDKPLDDESIASREHLILNALGGHKRIRGLLCVNCNNVAGARWDSELVKQLKPLALLFDVQRQDGEETPPAKFETTDGREFWLNADGSMNRAAKPFSKVPKGDGGWQIRLTPRSMEDAKKILKGIAAKYPEVDAERALASAEARFEYLDVPLIMTLDVGGELAGRAIVKSALCFAVANDVEPSACTPARAYLRDASAQAPFGYYYARDLVRNRPQQAPLHCVAVSNRDTGGDLLGYVEFFGFYRMVVRLASGYQGHDVHALYAVNPMTAGELALDVDISLSPSEVTACFAYERIPDGWHEAIMANLMPVAQRRAFELEKDRVIRRAFDYAMKECGVPEGGELPPVQGESCLS